MPQDFIAGGCAGGSGILAGYPFDTVKVLIQNQVCKPIRYRSTFQTMLLVTREDGFRRLYRGLATPLFTVAFYNAVTFSAYEDAVRKLPHHCWANHAMAGALSGLPRSVIICPVEVVKTQMQVASTKASISGSECIKQIYKSSGLKGFAKGYLTTLVREVLFLACYFASFEIMTRNRKTEKLTVLIAGGLAGIISWIPTYPIDVIKTRLQGDSLGEQKLYKSTMHCFKRK